VRRAGVICAVLYACAVLVHPIYLVALVFIVPAWFLWLAASSALGAARLLRYGGRRARRDWRAGR
jgi:hypothetical protein